MAFNSFFDSREEEKQSKLRFLQRSSLIISATVIPIAIYNTIVTGILGLLVSIGCIAALAVIHFLARAGKLKAAIIFAILVFYPVVTLSPYFSGPIHSMSASFLMLFLIVSYLAKERWLRMFNLIICIITYSLHIAILSTFEVESFLFSFWGNIFNGLTTFAIIILLSGRYYRDLLAYRNKLEEANDFLSQISDLNPHLIFAKDTERKFIFVNKAISRMCGLPKEEIIGKRAEEIHPEFEENDRFKIDDLKVLNSGENVLIESEKVFNKLNEDRWSKSIKTPIKDKEGNILGLLGVGMDITEELESSKELAHSYSMLETTLESSRDGILVVDLEGRVTNYNQAYCHLWALDKETMALGMDDCNQVLHKVLDQIEDGESFLERVVSSFKVKDAFLREMLQLKDDRVIEYNCYPQILDGDFIGRVWSFRDITVRVRSEQALIHSERRFKSLFHHSFDAVLVYDIEKEHYTDVNGVACKMFSYSRREFLNEKHRLTIVPEYQQDGELSAFEMKDHLRRVGQGETIRFEFLHKRKKGEIFPSETTLIPNPINRNELLIIIKDISKEKEKEQIIHQQMQDLNEKNDKLKTYIKSNLQLENFAYMASHDLREPLITINSFVEQLNKKAAPKLNNQELRFLEFISKSAKNMQDLVEDLLYYSIVSNEETEFESICLPDLLREVLASLDVELTQQKAEVKFTGIPTEIVGNPVQIRQLFQNLIANGVKFKQEDISPIVNIKVEETDEYWEIRVEDNGIGIEEKYYEKIFLLFRKLHNRSSYSGTGVGLALCKQIVENHKGNIWLESWPGEGTCFHFTLKKKPALIPAPLEKR